MVMSVIVSYYTCMIELGHGYNIITLDIMLTSSKGHMVIRFDQNYKLFRWGNTLV